MSASGDFVEVSQAALEALDVGVAGEVFARAVAAGAFDTLLVDGRPCLRRSELATWCRGAAAASSSCSPADAGSELAAALATVALARRSE